MIEAMIALIIIANYQCHNIEDVERVVSTINECFEYLLPALDKKRANLIYDDIIESRGLRTGSNSLIADISSITKGDIKKRWFLYTKKHARKAITEVCHVVVSSISGEVSTEGNMRQELAVQDAQWLSFSSAPPHDDSPLQVSQADSGTTVNIINSANLNSFKACLPQYEPSPKHRKEGYQGEGGEWISPMPLEPLKAQEVLLGSIQNGQDRYAFYKDKYYKFPLTQNNIFHGFVVEKDKVPPAILKDL